MHTLLLKYCFYTFIITIVTNELIEDTKSKFITLNI